MGLTQILKSIGAVMILVALSLLTPLLCLFAYPEELIYIKDFLIPAAIALVVGGCLFFFIKPAKEGKFYNSLSSSTLVVLSWVVAIFFGALPFVFSGQLDMLMAVFESASGWTTTGFTVMDVSKVPNVFLLWRSITQLLGGLGVVFLLMGTAKGGNGMVLFSAEGHSDRLHPNVKKTISLTLKLYAAFFVGGVVLYCVFGMPLFDAINHTMAAISTAGFTTQTASIGAYNSIPIEVVTILLMLLGSIGFAAHALLVKGKIKKFFQVTEIRIYLGIIVIFTFILSFFTGFREAIFNIVSVMSTTGFSTVNYATWGGASHGVVVLLMILVMLVGGGTGSTAGGIKQFRIAVALKSAVWEFKRKFLPERTVKSNYIIRPNGKFFVQDRFLVDVYNYIVAYIVLWFVGTFIVCVSGYGFSDSLFEISSALATAGASVGVVSPDMPVQVTWTVIVCMVIGRLEFVVLFTAIINVFRDSKNFIASKFKKEI
ncbi:MAG: TrkH family potassium uptake protein [Clostridia bacterium]|nr:TrkH family potassium uptake protein [Clostridia bacterium]